MTSDDHRGPAPRAAIEHWIARLRPRTRAELSRWIEIVLGIEPTGTSLLEGSDAPLDYLEWSFLGQRPGAISAAPGTSDCVVWAARGSGKTLYAAIATVLDLVFRPGIEVKALGGSREQAQRMHAHLRRMFERPGLRDLVDGKIGERRGRLSNGSTVEVLAQSERSVRGTRPQKLRCDEVELFDDDVWAAAQLVTRSRWFGRGHDRVFVPGAVEAFSTCHRAGGLMSRLIAAAGERRDRRVFRWTVIDVLESCPPARACAECDLLPECAGRAKHRTGSGHFLIDDAITMKRRSGAGSWESEMLCKRPLRRGAVFPDFDPARHVISGAVPPPDGSRAWIAGMDFGFRSPTVIVWATVDSTDVVRVTDERVEAGILLDAHIQAIMNPPPADEGAGPARAVPCWIGVDPAGSQRSDQTGLSPITLLRRAGLTVKFRPSSIEEGLTLIRARLAPASGPPTLFIHQRCTRLIQCLMNYRFPDDERIHTPLKDGHDHAVDALRYMLINHEAARRVAVGRY